MLDDYFSDTLETETLDEKEERFKKEQSKEASSFFGKYEVRNRLGTGQDRLDQIKRQNDKRLSAFSATENLLEKISPFKDELRFAACSMEYPDAFDAVSEKRDRDRKRILIAKYGIKN